MMLRTTFIMFAEMSWFSSFFFFMLTMKELLPL